MARHRFHGGQIIKRHAHEAAHQWLEAGLHLAVARGRECRQGTAMERLFHDDDGGIVHALAMSKKARQLDRRLIGLTTGITHKHFAHAGDGCQAVAQLLLFRDAINIGQMQDTPCLFRQRLEQTWMRMPQRIHGDASQGIEIVLACRIKEACALTVTERHRLACIDIHQMRHVSTLGITYQYDR